MSEEAVRSGAAAFAAELAALSPALLAGPSASDGVRLRADLLPASTWGSNLRGLLSPTQWDRLRAPVLAAAGLRCQICGAARPARRPDCHEQWIFGLEAIVPGDIPLPVQRLVRLVALCPACHEVQHVGLAGLRERLAEVRARLGQLNSWTPAQVSADLDRAARRSVLLEQVPWDLDLRTLAGQIEIPGFPDLYLDAAARERLGHADSRRARPTRASRQSAWPRSRSST